MRARLVLGAVLVLAPAIAAAGPLPPPPPILTPASIGATPRWVPVCGRGRPVGSGNWDASDQYVFDVSGCTTPAALGVRALRLSYMGSDFSNVGEVDRQVSMTGDVAVSVPGLTFSVVVASAVAIATTPPVSIPVQIAAASPGNGISVGMGVSGTGIPSGSWIASVTPTVTSSNVTTLALTFTNASASTNITQALTAGQVLTITGRNHLATWGGARSTTIVPARRFFDSDPIGLALGPLSPFFVRGSWTASAATGFFVGDYPSPSSGTTRLSGEGSQRATSSLGDHVMDQYTPSNSGGGYWSPWTVLGQVTAPTASVLLVGDSICAGTGDAADGYGHMGYMERSLGQSVPWASLCRGSTSAQQMSVNLQLVEQAAAEIGATDVLLEYGRNDLNASGNPQSAASTEGYLATIAAPLIAAGYRVYAFTCPPTTDSTDGWASSTGQFFQQQATNVTTSTAAGAAGAAVTVSVSSSSGVQQGELAGYQSAASTIIPTGTTVTAIPSATSVTLTPPSGQSIGVIPSGTTLGFGTKTVGSSTTPIEYQRQAFNSYMRANWRSAGYAGLVDVDSIVEDANTVGFWRTDLGAASLEGIHPSAVLHTKLVSAGIITPAMFPAR